MRERNYCFHTEHRLENGGRGVVEWEGSWWGGDRCHFTMMKFISSWGFIFFPLPVCDLDMKLAETWFVWASKPWWPNVWPQTCVLHFLVFTVASVLWFFVLKSFIDAAYSQETIMIMVHISFQSLELSLDTEMCEKGWSLPERGRVSVIYDCILEYNAASSRFGKIIFSLSSKLPSWCHVVWGPVIWGCVA